MLESRLAEARLPPEFAVRLGAALNRACRAAEQSVGHETLARAAATALYNAASAVLLAWEGSHPGTDGRRLLVARCVLDHRLSARDPLAPGEPAWERPVARILTGADAITAADAAPLLA